MRVVRIANVDKEEYFFNKKSLLNFHLEDFQLNLFYLKRL